jgi:hypothetical protein
MTLLQPVRKRPSSSPSFGRTAEPQNTEPQNGEGTAGNAAGRLRHSEFLVRYSAVRLGHALTGEIRNFHAGVHSAATVEAHGGVNGGAERRPRVEARVETGSASGRLPFRRGVRAESHGHHDQRPATARTAQERHRRGRAFGQGDGLGRSARRRGDASLLYTCCPPSFMSPHRPHQQAIFNCIM